MSTGDVVEVRDRWQNCRGAHLRRVMVNLDASLYTFIHNRQDLTRLLNTANEPTGVRTRWERIGGTKGLLFEAVRICHNFLASAASLKLHTDTAMAELYAGNPFHDEYKAEVKRVFGGDPHSALIADLRNYAMHYGVPLTSARSHFTGGTVGGVSGTVLLRLGDMRQWSRWSSQSLSLIRELGEDVPLASVVNPYVDLVEGFQRWLRDRHREMHQEEYREYCQLEEEWHALFRGPTN